jgi:hypothetical protein
MSAVFILMSFGVSRFAERLVATETAGAIAHALLVTKP